MEKKMKEYLEKKYLVYSWMDEKAGSKAFVDFEVELDCFYSKLGRLIRKLEDECTDYDTEELKYIFKGCCHMNPLLRNNVPVKMERLDKLMDFYKVKEKNNMIRKFYHTLGAEVSCLAHELRAECKKIVRTIHLVEGGYNKDELIGWFSITSLYLFNVAYELNELLGYENIEYESEIYKF